MSYTLEITFTGLFTFVPHAERNRLYVLLPTTRDTPHHHLPVLKHHKLTNAPHHFDREHLRLEGIEAATGTTINVPPEAFDLSEITGKRLPRKQVEDVPTDRVRLRIELPPATSISAGKPAHWKLNGRRRLSHEIVWTRSGLTLPEIKFARELLGGGSKSPLTFQPQGSKVRLYFHHLPGLNMCVGQNEEAEHFALYYSLYDPPENGPNPVLDESPPFPCLPHSHHKHRRRPTSKRNEKSASTFTCMTSQG